MPLTALLLDLDGTLVDTNPYHLRAYARVLREHGYDVPEERIARGIGMGGDLLVPELIGEEGERADGEAIREAVGRVFTEELARQHTFRLFPGAIELLAALRERGLRTAIATSAEGDFLNAIFESVGTDLREHVDETVTASDVDASKPEPDVVEAALRKLGVDPEETVLVGDTRYDVDASRRAGVGAIGVSTWAWTEDELRAAGARRTYPEVIALLDRLGDALQI
jgi:HAD superfamily hydrolase (TIGR01509 family)